MNPIKGLVFKKNGIEYIVTGLWGIIEPNTVEFKTLSWDSEVKHYSMDYGLFKAKVTAENYIKTIWNRS